MRALSREKALTVREAAGLAARWMEANEHTGGGRG